MTNPLLRALAALVLSLTGVVSFSGCQAMNAVLPAPLADTLQQVTSFTDGIVDWQAGLEGMLGDTQLARLGEYADQAKGLGSQIAGMAEGVEQAMADPLAAIGGKLSEMGGLDMGVLKDLAPQAQVEALGAFTDQARSVGTMAQDFLTKFGG